MKSIWLWACICALWPAKINAQEIISPVKPPQAYLAVAVQNTQPVGSFQFMSGNEAGYAKQGFALKAEGASYLSPHFGLGAYLGIYDNPADALSWFNTALENIVTAEEITLKSTSWQVKQLMLGPVVHIPLEGAVVDFKIGLGYLGATTPRFSFGFLDDENNEIEFVSKASSGSGFGFTSGINFRLPLSAHIDLLANVDYVTGKPKINIVNETLVNGQVVEQVKYDAFQGVGLLNMGVGLVLKFAQ